MKRTKSSPSLSVIGLSMIVAVVATLGTITAFMQQAPSSNVQEERRVSPYDKRPPVDESKEKSETPTPSVVLAGTPSSANYTFLTNTTSSLAQDLNSNTVDMTTGTTLLSSSSVDEGSPAAASIGFDFYLMGNRYSQFNVTTNGLVSLSNTSTTASGSTYVASGGTTTTPILSAFAADLGTGTSGKTHYKVIGSAPNRTLVIEFNNMTLLWTSSFTNDGTFQVRLYESTGIVEFVYGAMSITSTASASDITVGIGFSTNTTTNNLAYVTSATNAVSYTASFTDNPTYSTGAITNLNSAANGSRRTYRFTPPTPTVPTSLNFTAVTSTSMTLNWTDSPNEVGYAIYRSTDGGSTYSFFGSAASDATSFNATGLTSSTTYFWRVFAISEGALSSALSGSQATNAPTTITSNAVTGNWSAPGTWAGGVVPTASDNAVIADGATVTIDTAANCLNLTVGQGASGILQFELTTARTMTVAGNSTIASGGTFRSNTAGTQTGHSLSAAGDLTNNGTLDFSTNGNTAAAGITFTGSANNTFSGTGATTDLRTLTINKGTSSASTLEITTSNLTVQGTSTDGTPMAFLTLTNGTLKISSTFTVTGRVFTVAAYSIGSTAGFWLNNANFTVAGQNGSPTNTGLLRISAGTYTVGTASGNAMSGAGAYTIEGGTLNVAGRLNPSTTATYTQAAGIVNVNTIGNASSSNGSFDVSSTSGTVSISGGTINLVQASTAVTPLDFRIAPTAPTITGGTLNVGTAATATNFNFRISGATPAMVVDNTTNNKTATLFAAVNTFGNATINAGATINLNGFIHTVTGATFTNNGTLTGTTASSRLYFFGSTAQTFAGSGTVTSPLDGLSFDNSAGVSITHTNSIPTLRVNLFRGTVTNSNKLTLGTGAALAVTTQVGSAGLLTAGGSYDVSPTFNLGTGAYSVLYQQEGSARTSGFEIPATRSVANVSINNTNGVTIAGGGLAITSTLTLTAGNLSTTTSNLPTITNTATGGISGGSTTSYVNGPLARILPASLASGSTYTFPVGKSAFKLFELVNPTTTAGGTVTVQAEVFDANSGGTAGTGISALNTNRYWQSSLTSGAGNFTNTTVRLTESGLSVASRIGQSATQSGTYNSIGGNAPGSTILSNTITTLGFFNIGAVTLSAGTYTVGSGGTYGTLTAAAADYNSKSITGAVVFSLTDASYSAGETFPVTLNANAGASASNTLTIRPASGVTTTISGSNATAIFDLNGATFVTIDGSNSGGLAPTPLSPKGDLTISNTSTSGATIRFINAASNNTVKNSILRGVTTSTANGVVFFSTVATGTIGNSSNTIQNNDIRAGATASAYGVYNLGTSTAKNTNNLITGNRIFDFSTNGIRDDGNSATTTYSSNEIFESTTQTTSLAGFRPSATSIDSFTFTRNYIHDLNTSSTSTVYGIHLFDTNSAAAACVVSNNMITLSPTAPLTLRGIYDQTATGEKYNIYFNSIYLSGTVSGASNSESYYWSIASTSDVRDNIFVNARTGGTGKHYAYRTNTTLANLTSDYNDIFSTGGTGNVFGNNGTADIANLATWQAAPTTGTGKDANSKSGDPLFTSATDLHINTGSNYSAPPPVSNAGTTISGVTSDFDSDTRSSTPDIGADEVTITRNLSGSNTLPAGNYDSVTVNSPDTATLGANVSISGSLTVKNGATLNLGTSIVSGAGTFTIEAGGTLGVGSPNGVTTSGATGNMQVTGTRTYTAGANYVYNGSAAQVTGNALSNAPNNLTINNTAGVMSSVTGLTVTGTLRVQAGTFTSASTYKNVQIDNGATLAASSGETISVTGSWLNNGTFTKNGSTVVFSGSSAQTISGSQPTIFNGLTISNSAGVTLAVNTEVDGVLALTSGDIATGSNTLIMGVNAPDSTGSFDVVGNVNRTDVTSGQKRTFGNPDNQITSSGAGTITSITVNLTKGAAPNDFSNAIQRIYTVTANGGTALAATVRLRYLQSELNSNPEDATLILWRNPATWTQEGRTSNDGSANWVEKLAVVLTNALVERWVMAGPNTPTDVAMMNFKATRYDKQVLLEWQTGYEVSNVGFNIYREKNGRLERITPEPVAGSALIAGPRVELRAGLAYSWWDEDVADCGSGNADCQNLRYWIEDIDLSGRTTNHGPFGVSEPGVGDQQPGDRAVLGRHKSALLSALGRDASLAQTAEAATVPVEPTATVTKMTAARMSIQSGVASQAAVKLSIQREGWYRVEQSELAAAGFPSDADPAMLQLLADGKEVAMLVTGGSGGAGGGGAIGGVTGGGGKTTEWTGIEFYGIGINSPSTVNHVYWLVVGSQPGLRIATSDAKGGSPAAGNFAYAVERRDKTVYFPALKNGGAEKWFGPLIFNAQPVDQSVMVQHAAGSVSGLLLVSLQGFTNTAHSVRVVFNGVEAGTMHFAGLQKAAQKFVIQAGNIHEGVNQIQLIGPPGTSDLSLVDYVQLNYFHTNTSDNNALRMPATGQQQVTIDGFSSSAIRVMDVTDASSPVELKTTVNGAAASKTTSSSYSVTVTAPGSGAPGVRTLLAFASDQQKRPAQIAANQPSNYRDPNQRADYVVITRKELIGSFDPLIDLRKSQGLAPMVIDIEDLYDEFSFGNKSPQAVKDFLTYAKTSWAKAPRFVVLGGDATYDPKNYAGLGDFDVVPTRLVETAYNEAATDDWFADVNGDGVPDMAIGRLPVRTAGEAAAMVAKLVSYDASVGSSTVLLVADRNSSFDFEAADTQLRSLIPASLTVTDIRRGQVGDAEARSQLLTALNQGAKVVNYYGHGSTTVWTDAPILSGSDAAGLTNRDHLSLVVSMTCLNGYFHAPTIESLGESLLKAQGGAIAVWASSGLTDAQAQTVMSRDAISRLLSGSSLTIGEVVALAKGSTTDVDVRRTWILLGDPATKLK